MKSLFLLTLGISIALIVHSLDLRCSTGIGLSEWYRLIAPCGKKVQKAGAPGTYYGISIAVAIHSLDCTLQIYPSLSTRLTARYSPIDSVL